jgi:hypothetical integral membrane protein (TIGR02206 family)
VILAQIGSSFQTFGPAHLATIGLTMVAAVALALWVRRMNSVGSRRTACAALAATLVVNELGWYAYRFAVDGAALAAREALPVHICGVAVFLTAWTLVRPSRSVYEVAYYWGLAGAVQAILTPNLSKGFPSYEFVQYFVCHSGIVVGVLVATWGLRLRPGRWSVLRVFGLTAVWAAVVAGFNLLIGANYMFLCRAPEGQSPFFFLAWPWYLAFLAGLGLVLFTLLYLPFVVADRVRARRAGAEESPR